MRIWGSLWKIYQQIHNKISDLSFEIHNKISDVHATFRVLYCRGALVWRSEWNDKKTLRKNPLRSLYFLVSVKYQILSKQYLQCEGC